LCNFLHVFLKQHNAMFLHSSLDYRNRHV